MFLDENNVPEIFIHNYTQNLHNVTYSTPYSAYSDNCYFHFYYRLFDWVSRNFLLNRFWKCQVSIMKNKKVLFLKNNNLLSIWKQKSFVYWPNFQWRFLYWIVLHAFAWCHKSEIILDYPGILLIHIIYRWMKNVKLSYFDCKAKM